MKRLPNRTRRQVAALYAKYTGMGYSGRDALKLAGPDIARLTGGTVPHMCTVRAWCHAFDIALPKTRPGRAKRILTKHTQA